MHIGTVNSYNNFIQIASDDMSLGYNAEVNEEAAPQNKELPQNDDFSGSTTENLQPEPTAPEVKPQGGGDDTPLSHDEKKLSMILGAAVIGLAISYFC